MFQKNVFSSWKCWDVVPCCRVQAPAAKSQRVATTGLPASRRAVSNSDSEKDTQRWGLKIGLYRTPQIAVLCHFSRG